MSLDLRDQLRQRYGTPRTSVDDLPDLPSGGGEVGEVSRAFAFKSEAGRTVITAPLREIALKNDGFMYLHGRFVEADTPNGNGALWTTEDLQLGQETVAGGPLNWLHDDRKIIGTLLSGDLVHTREEAKMPSGANAPYKIVMEGGKFCVHNNAGECKAKFDTKAKAEDYLKALYANVPGAAKRADKVPFTGDAKNRQKSDLGIGNHIESTAAVWRFLFPQEAQTIERAAADKGLFYSMECVSRQVACVDAPGRPGCGSEFSYADYDAGRTCSCLREKSSIRRFVNPVFLGGAVIVPPIQPGWGRAEVDVVRQAAQLTEQHGLADQIDREAAEAMTAQILMWANR